MCNIPRQQPNGNGEVEQQRIHEHDPREREALVAEGVQRSAGIGGERHQHSHRQQRLDVGAADGWAKVIPAVHHHHQRQRRDQVDRVATGEQRLPSFEEREVAHPGDASHLRRAPCRKLAAVDSLVVNLGIPEQHANSEREPPRAGTRLRLPQLGREQRQACTAGNLPGAVGDAPRLPVAPGAVAERRGANHEPDSIGRFHAFGACRGLNIALSSQSAWILRSDSCRARNS